MSRNDDGYAITKAVDQKIDKVRTRSLDLSFNELVDMYENEELIIHPEYQRLFRWSEEKRSALIESLILEMPIPPIFVIEREEGEYELIDGLQRISSYLHFRGSLVQDEEKVSPLRLVGCDIVDELNGLTYEDLPKPLQIRLKRNFIRVEILRKESDGRLRYYMFKRLNTGGERLSDQEIRNCTIRLLDETFNAFIIELSGNADFRTCIEVLSDEKFKEKYDQELVLRFFAFKNGRDNYKHDVGSFMTDYMESVSEASTPFDYATERAAFEKTFLILRKTLGRDTFCAYKGGGFVARFLSYHYEAVTLGIQPYLEQIDPDDEDAISTLKDTLYGIKQDEEFRQLTTGGGKNYHNQLEKRIDFVENRVGESL